MGVFPTWGEKLDYIKGAAKYTHEATKTYPVPYKAPTVKPALKIMDWRFPEISPHVPAKPVAKTVKQGAKDFKTIQEHKIAEVGYFANKYLQWAIPGYGIASTLLKTSSAPWDVTNRPLPIQSPEGVFLSPRETSPYLPIVTRDTPTASKIPSTGVSSWVQEAGKWQNTLIIGAVIVGGVWLLGKFLGGNLGK